MLRFETVVVSDIHLGARNSRTDDFLRFLDILEVDRLVIAGDLFESPVLQGLRDPHLRVLEALRQFGCSSEFVWLRGNHDPDEAWCRDVLDLTCQDELVVNVGRRKYLVRHGHLWDRAMSLPNSIVQAADWVYQGAQWVDPSHRLARHLKRNTKFFCRVVDGLRREATAAARMRNMHGVVVGHSHVASDEEFGGQHYLNCGCWTEQPAGFVGIRDGFAQQRAWSATRQFCLTGYQASTPRSAAVGAALLAANGEGG